MINRSQFGDSDESDSSQNEQDDNLPFPKPLARSSFLAPDFDPTTFLSSLSNRHQTLGDLQSELRELSQSLNKELLDLVNDNYQDFLSLGTALKGGEEKVQEVRAALLAFERDVQTVREQFIARKGEVRCLLSEKKTTRSGIAMGYDLLDISGRIDVLEQNLMIRKDSAENGVSEQDGAEEDRDSGRAVADDEASDDTLESEADDSDEEDVPGDRTDRAAVVSLHRLERHVDDFLCLKAIIGRVGDKHPFVVNHEDRIAAIKSALQLDINTAMRHAAGVGKRRQDRALTALRLHRLIGEHGEATSAFLDLSPLNISQ